MSDQKVLETGTFTATEQSDAVSVYGPFNISLTGFGVATVMLQASFDEGVSWVDVQSFSGNAPKLQGDEPELGVLYRFNCTSYTSGAIAYRISQ